MNNHYTTLIALLAIGRIAQAQDPTPGVDLPTDARSSITARDARYVGIPVLRSTPMLGFGLGAVGAMFGRLDSASSPSVIGVGGAYSQTRSWMFDAEMVEMLGRLMGNLYVGPRYLHRGVTTTLRDASATDPLTAIARQNQDYQLSALGIEAAYDTRDSMDAPHHGTEAELSVLFGRDWLGTTDSYNGYRGWINHYVALPSHSVLGLRLAGCSVDANAPIWELCMYGINADLRGYAGGRYRDRTMFATQAELRVPLVSRLATNLFGGVGSIAPSISSIAMPELLPSAGIGLQYLVPGSHRLTVGSDVAWGKNGAAFYLRLGNAF
jgi:hypothetical protein